MTKILTSSSEAPIADQRVVSTLEADGSRCWIHPRLATGKLWQARRLIAYLLIAIYALVPYIRLNGAPLVLIDVIHRRFHFFGFTFLPTDTTLLALLVLIFGLTVFFATAVLGRVWCGWACPQTVYMEFVFRPIERLFTGTVSRGGKPKNVAIWRVIAMYAVFMLISIHLANMLLAYFIGTEQVHRYIWASTPLQHPGAFAVVALASAWIMWDFAYWREQMCIIGCPYGRMQSVLLDRNSLIVSYDYRRGEPRGKASRRLTLKTFEPSTPKPGDCVDCTMCVQVCPTGIDIRDGLQLECVNCTQCIDACNTVMDKVGRPRGLVGFSSQGLRDGEPVRWLRPRVVIYPLLIAILLAIFSYSLFMRAGFDLTVMRNAGRAFNVLPDGRIENTMRIKLVNRERSPRTYSIDLVGVEGVSVTTDIEPRLTPLESATAIVRVSMPPERFVSDHVDVQLRIRTDSGETHERYIRLLGPAARSASEVQP